ncbi:MAG: CUB domain-containing protein [Candidatus Kapaibacteriota bacterium]
MNRFTQILPGISAGRHDSQKVSITFLILTVISLVFMQEDRVYGQPLPPPMPSRMYRSEIPLMRSDAAWRRVGKNTSQTNAAPTLNSPPNNGTNIPIVPFFYANPVAGSTYYDFQVSARADFSDTPVGMYNYYGDGSGRTDGLVWNTTNARTPLANNTRYYWRVRAFGSTEWSATWSFTTAPASTAPTIPTLTTPVNGATNVALQPDFTWTGTNANGFIYYIQYSPDPTFTFGFGNVGSDQRWFSSGSSALQYNPSQLSDTLLPGTRYYWRVRAISENGTSSFSSVSSFTTQGPTPIFTQVPLQSVANGTMGNLSSPLSGSYNLGNISFSFPSNATKIFGSQNQGGTSLPTQCIIPVNVSNVQNAYLLLDGAYILQSLQGQAIGNVVLSFANGATQTLTLRAGEHISEQWAYVRPLDNEQYSGRVITDFPSAGMSSNGRTEDQVRDGKPAWGFVRVLKIPVSANLRSQRLTSITLNDTSPIAGMTLSGITVESTTPANRPPRIITALPNLMLPPARGSQFSLNTYFTDDDGDALTYSVSSNAPSQVSVSVNASGLVTVQPLPGASPGGTATISITVNDGRGGTVTGTFTVTVTNPEMRSCSGTTTLTSASGSFSDRTISTSEYDNNLDCRWIIQPSAGASSITISFSSFMTELGFDAVSIYSGTSISGAPLYNFSGSTVPRTVTINASAVLVRFFTDGSAAGAGWTLNYTSSNAPTNRPPRITSSLPTSIIQLGQGFVFTLSNNFFDDDGDALSYTVTSNNPNVASASVSNGRLTVQGVSLGMATITVTANDGRGGTVSTSFAVTITPAAASRTFDGGITVSPFPFSQTDSILISVDVTQTYPRRPEPASLAGTTQLWIHGGVNTGAVGNSNTRWQKIIGAWRMYPSRCQFTRRSDNTNIFELRLRPSNFWELQSNEVISELCFVLNNGANGVGEGGAVPILGGDPLKGDFFIPVTATSTNRPPRVTQSIPNQTIQVGRSLQIPLTSIFTDDDRDALTFSAVSNSPNAVTVNVSSSGGLNFQGVNAGTSTISVTANDGRGGMITTTFVVTVEALSCFGITTLTSVSGSFTDRTNGAAAYTNNLDCRWVIQPSSATNSITATFSRFSTETCCDVVEIYTGTTVTGQPLYRFSGSSIPSFVSVQELLCKR